MKAGANGLYTERLIDYRTLVGTYSQFITEPIPEGVVLKAYYATSNILIQEWTAINILWYLGRGYGLTGLFNWVQFNSLME